jgi:HSP20 family protein
MQMLERYDPLGRMTSLRQMMDRLLEDAFVLPREPSTTTTTGVGTAALNAYEEGDHLVVETPLPGIRPEDIDVSVEGGTLTIRGQARAEEERRERNYFVREYRTGSFSRSIRLPETVDAEACQASFEHGVLRLTFPRAERARPRRIEVRGAGPPPTLPVGGPPSGTRAGATRASTPSEPASTGGAARRRAPGATGATEQPTQPGRRPRRGAQQGRETP